MSKTTDPKDISEEDIYFDKDTLGCDLKYFNPHHIHAFEFESEEFTSVIPFICAKYCEFFGKDKARKSIMKKKTTTKIIKIALQVTSATDQEIEDWNNLLFKHIVQAYHSKFYTTQKIYDLVIQSKAKEIMYCDVDPICGIGLGFEHPNIQQRNFWKGANYIGKGIMTARIMCLMYERANIECDKEFLKTIQY